MTSDQALENYLKAKELGEEIGSRTLLKDTYENIAKCYSALSDYRKALEYQRLYSITKDSLSNAATITKLWTAYMAEKLAPEELQLAKTFAENRGNYVQQGLKPAAAALRASNIAEAQRIYTDVVSPAFEKVRDSLAPLIQLQISEAKAEYESAVARSTLIKWLALGSLAIGLPLAGLWSYLLIRNLSRSLDRAVEVANAVAHGDLNQHIQTDGNDELAKLIVAQPSRFG